MINFTLSRIARRRPEGKHYDNQAKTRSPDYPRRLGHQPRPDGNAVFRQNPNIDRYLARYPWSRLSCSGEAVGLPEGYQGSSEVGHLNMGAGRGDPGTQAYRRRPQQRRALQAARWQEMIANWKASGGRLHLLGLLQDEGVHAHQEHLFKIMRRARGEHPAGRIIIHPFLDGRDTPPRSTLEYLGRLGIEMREVGNCRIGTVMGRYYAMDRSRQYALTDAAFACLVDAKGRRAVNAESAVKASYEADRTPDGTEMVDEYIPCHVIGDYDGIHDGDCVMHTNYRQDRAIQLSQAFVSDDYPGARARKITYLGFTRYWTSSRTTCSGDGCRRRHGQPPRRGHLSGLRQLASPRRRSSAT